MSALLFESVEEKFSGAERFFSGLPRQHTAQARRQDLGSFSDPDLRQIARVHSRNIAGNDGKSSAINRL